MPRSEKSNTTMLSHSYSHQLAVADLQSETSGFRQPERLSLELDFSGISHPSESGTSTTHPHVLFSPVHYESGYAYPLLVWLHGSGGDERQVMRVMPSISMRNYVAVAPRGQATENDADQPEPTRGRGRLTDVDSPSLDVASILRQRCRAKTFYDWPDTEQCLGDAEQRIFDCVAVAKKRCNIASNRVFLAGFGNGGTLALRLAMLYPEHFAGVASLGGAFPMPHRVLPRWVAARSMNVFLGVGETSSVFTPQNACDTLELLHTAGVSVAVREYPCGQELVPAMLQDLNRWMMGIVCDS